MTRITIKYEDFEGTPYVYEYQYPSERELLDIFPEAKGIIPLKINEWLRRKGKLLAKETIPYLKKCNALKSEFAKAFWKEVYVCCAGGFNETINQLKRLRRLEAFINCPKQYENFEIKIQQAKETPITSIYDFKKLRRHGQSYSACCPLHNDKTPSFKIYPDNSWWCFGCNQGGDAISLAEAIHNLNFKEAVNYLAGGAR